MEGFQAYGEALTGVNVGMTGRVLCHRNAPVIGLQYAMPMAVVNRYAESPICPINYFVISIHSTMTIA